MTQERMRDPLYALLISPDEKDRKAIVAGEKTVSVRTGFRRYKPGTTIMLACQIVPWAVKADVVKVRFCTFKDLTLEEVKKDGFETLKDLFKDLKQYYSDINWDSEVTVIEWANVQGALVDEYLNSDKRDAYNL